jgi:hypothetical protein
VIILPQQLSFTLTAPSWKTGRNFFELWERGVEHYSVEGKFGLV